MKSALDMVEKSPEETVADEEVFVPAADVWELVV